MAGKQRESRGYRYVVAGGSLIIRLLLIVLAIVILLAIAKISYSRGYALFQTKEASEDLD